MVFRQEMELFLRARFTMIWVVTHEEGRLLEELRQLCEAGRRTLLTWDLAAGFSAEANPPPVCPEARDPKTALEAIDKADETRDSVFLLKDFHLCLDRQPVIVRQLRNLVSRLKLTRKSLVVCSPVARIPEELKDEVFLMELAPPEVPQLEQILDRLVAGSQIRVDLTPLGREKILQAALGLSANQARRVFGKAIVAEVRDGLGRVLKPAGCLDERGIDMIMAEKKAIVRESGALEFYSPEETLADVGGLEVLKEWLRQREKAFSQEARDYGLPAPKGIALIGIPGTGKSLTARMVAGLWHLPLVRLDMGALFGGLVGQSEENTRRALALVETISPCLLWIDEMEKGFAFGGGDGGTSQRVFQSFLTWMQEKRKPVFVIGTANHIAALPPNSCAGGALTRSSSWIFRLPWSGARSSRCTSRSADALRRWRPRGPGGGLGRLCGGRDRAGRGRRHVSGLQRPRGSGPGFHHGRHPPGPGPPVPLSRSQVEAIQALRLWLVEGRAQSASYAETSRWQENAVALQPPAGTASST